MHLILFISDYHHICFYCYAHRFTPPFISPRALFMLHCNRVFQTPEHITLDGKIEEMRLNKIFMTTTALVRDIQ